MPLHDFGLLYVRWMYTSSIIELLNEVWGWIASPQIDYKLLSFNFLEYIFQIRQSESNWNAAKSHLITYSYIYWRCLVYLENFRRFSWNKKEIHTKYWKKFCNHACKVVKNCERKFQTILEWMNKLSSETLQHYNV